MDQKHSSKQPYIKTGYSVPWWMETPWMIIWGAHQKRRPEKFESYFGTWRGIIPWDGRDPHEPHCWHNPNILDLMSQISSTLSQTQYARVQCKAKLCWHPHVFCAFPSLSLYLNTASVWVNGQQQRLNFGQIVCYHQKAIHKMSQHKTHPSFLEALGFVVLYINSRACILGLWAQPTKILRLCRLLRFWVVRRYNLTFVYA